MPSGSEVLHLHVGVVPVALYQRMLLAQEVERGAVLGISEFVRILDAEIRLLCHQVDRGVGDVDRPVVGLDATLVRLAVRKLLRLEHCGPRRGRGLEHLGVVHEDVRSPLVRCPVVLAVDEVPGCFLQALVDRAVARNQADIHRLHGIAADQAQRSVARRSHEVVAALRHQRHHLVRGAGRFHVDLAAARFLETRYPVVALVSFAALDVTGPRDDVELAFGRTELFLGRLGGWRAALPASSGRPVPTAPAGTRLRNAPTGARS